jgi:hypothetical protein
MISLLDRSCELCRDISVLTEKGDEELSQIYYLRKVTSSATTCPLCMLADMVWHHFVDKLHSSDARVISVLGSSDGLITLGLGRRNASRAMDVQLCFTGMLQGTDPKISLSKAQAGLEHSENHMNRIHNVGSSPISPESISQLKGWIQECDSSHDNCSVRHTSSRTTQAFVPTRLIMLGPSTTEHVQLVSPTEPVHYVALSYCWGSSEQSRTLKSNVEMRKRQLLVTRLPQTLKDAIRMTQALNMNYLWIDSLCIIQDDENDWAIEASKMSEIYSYAWLVLAATGAPDCASGMLQTRDPPFVIPPNQLPGVTASLSVRRHKTHDRIGRRLVHDQPLWRRAWVRSPFLRSDVIRTISPSTSRTHDAHT